MKNNFYITIIFVGIIGLSISCNNDFLERAPIVSLSDANYWKSANDLKIYTNNFYNQNDFLPRYNAYGVIGPFTVDADQGSDTYIGYDYNNRINGEITLPSSGGGWAASNWSLLRNINYFMDHYSLVDESWDVVKQYVGEALFFRSIFYFDKLKTFGDLPWASTTVSIDSDLLYAARLPRNQVVDSIMLDLDRAVEYLPTRASGAWTGRITKETALALQARIALYEGTWERYHALKNTPFKVDGSNGTKFIQKAADAAGALMALADQNGYPGLANVGETDGYWKLFNQKDYSGNPEILLWRKYAQAESYHVWARYSNTGAGRGITKNLIDSYLCTDGKPISGNTLYQGDATLQDVVTNRDPRLNQTIYVDDDEHYLWYTPLTMFTVPSFEAANEQRSVTGYQMYKGHSADYNENYTSQGTTGCIYFRYAETLLIYAEAKAELGTITQEDIDKTINALRTRVGMPGLTISNITTDLNWEFTNLSPLLQEIRRERKVELACEGFRRDDIFRWAAADELIVGHRPKGAKKQQWENYPDVTENFLAVVANLPVDNNGYIDPYAVYASMAEGYKFQLDRDYLSPIPTNEITINPNLSQNPGW